jgi:imidazolonepropionase-like amidohydrolase
MSFLEIYKRTYGALWSQFKLPIPVLTIRALKNAMAEFKQGITTTRILGSVHNIDISLKYLFKNKYVVSPRLFISGQPLVATGSHAATLSQSVDGLDEFRKWTRERVQYVDWVKLLLVSIPLSQLMKRMSMQDLKSLKKKCK